MIQTPIQKLEFPNDRGVRLYCKREDLLPFSLGGNKVRIGRAFFQDMQEKNKDCMIIYGNSRSNLCRVLANLCCAEKIPCYMICSSEENEEQPIETNNSRLMKWLGAEVIPCRKTEIAQTVEQTMNRLTEEGYHPYYIFGDKFERAMKAHRYRPTWTATARFLRGRKNRTFLFLISLQHPEPARPSAAW